MVILLDKLVQHVSRNLMYQREQNFLLKLLEIHIFMSLTYEWHGPILKL